MTTARRFVYIIKSISAPDAYCVGVTSNVDLRLRMHNEGLSPHTSRHRPWRTLVVVEFDQQEPATKFERYLKAGSGLVRPGIRAPPLSSDGGASSTAPM